MPFRFLSILLTNFKAFFIYNSIFNLYYVSSSMVRDRVTRSKSTCRQSERRNGVFVESTSQMSGRELWQCRYNIFNEICGRIWSQTKESISLRRWRTHQILCKLEETSSCFCSATLDHLLGKLYIDKPFPRDTIYYIILTSLFTVGINRTDCVSHTASCLEC